MPRSKTEEIGELTSILNSRAFYEVLQKHRNNLQDDVNKFVRQEDLIKAFGALSKLDDIDKIIKLMRKKLEDLKTS